MALVAEHSACEIDAAEALYLQAMRDSTARIFRGEDLSKGPVHEIRGRIAFAAQLVSSKTVRIRFGQIRRYLHSRFDDLSGQ